MPRWEADAAGRLQRAALELFDERGFDRTTVAEIAKRAGLNERSFYRYFADKREVLFDGDGNLEAYLTQALEAAPAALSPLDAMLAILADAERMFLPKGLLRTRERVIEANPQLRERELIKLASLASAIADALRRRGVADPAASLSAEAGIAVFRIAFERWVDETNQRDLPELIRDSLDELKAVTAGK